MENTNNQNSQQQMIATKTVKKTRKVIVGKSIFYAIFIVLFAFTGFVMLCLDTDSIFRNKELYPGIADFLSNFDDFTDFLSSIHIGNFYFAFDIKMATWVAYFVFIALFLVIFTVLLFRKSILKKIDTKHILKKGEPLPSSKKVLFNVVYWLIAAVVAGALVGVLLGVLPKVLQDATHNPNLNIQYFGEHFTEFLQVLGYTVLLLLVFPLACLIIWAVFKLLVLLFGLIVSGVSKSVMQSEEYQETMAASQAAAADIASTMQEAKGLSADALARAKDAQKNGAPKKNSMAGYNIFPALDNIDKKYEAIAAEEEAKKAEEEAATAAAEAAAAKDGEAAPAPEAEVVEAPAAQEPQEITYEEFTQFAYEFQSYLCHQKYYFDLTIIRSFIAGLASSRMILLQGLSGTGKTTLPRVFLEYIGSKAWFFPVQATWRDRSDVTGYFSEFANEFKETEFLKHLYEASYTPEKVNLLVLDEMNISRVEYYFADFLSIFEYPSADWLVPLIQIHDDVVMPKKLEGGMARIPTNTWFIGTVNIDDSTFTITDKVYDRVIAIDFEELNIPFESDYPYDPHPLKCGELERMFAECRAHEENKLSEEEKLKFLKLAAFTADTFDVKFGNRIMNQIENFVPIFVALGGTKEQALDLMFANKILRKLNGKFESYIKDGLVKLTRYLNTEYGKGVFAKTEKLVNLISKKLA